MKISWKKAYKTRKQAIKKSLAIISEHAHPMQPQHICDFSYFKTEQAQKRFCSEVRKLGYLIEKTHSEAPGDLQYSVRFSRVEVVNEDVISRAYRDFGAL